MGKVTPSSSPRIDDGLTPAMRQYVEQKAAAPDALLLFRMGDFYETFFEDAENASRALGITLTTRGKGRDGNPIPLAGIPYHALESYLSKLVKAGYKVAISEQMEDPKQVKGVVRRDIVRIVTPGTLTDDALLEGTADNYLACICDNRGEIGLAFVELSTGSFCVQRTSLREIVDELVRLRPAELLLMEKPLDAGDSLGSALKELSGPGQAIPGLSITRRSAHLFDPYQAEARLKKHFGVATLEGFGFEKMDSSLCAAAVVIDYLSETQRGSLAHIVKVSLRQSSDFVCIDQATWRSLEIERTLRSGSAAGSLLAAIDRTCSPMGGRCMRRWLAGPLRDVDRIIERQQAIATLLSDLRRLTDLRDQLRGLADIERITARLGVGRASPRDLVALGITLGKVEGIAEQLNFSMRNAECGMRNNADGPDLLHSEFRIPNSAFITSRCEQMRGLHELGEYLTTSLMPEAPAVMNEGGMIAAGVDAELDRLRSIGTDGRAWLADYQAREIARTGIPSLKVGYNSVFGYYIEITHTHGQKAPPEYVRKQTVKNAERYITDELKKYESEVLTAHDQAVKREMDLFEAIRRRTATHIPALQELAAAVAEIDVTAGLACLADERRYVRPEFTKEITLDVEDGRHPVLEQSLGERFVPNDTCLGLRIADCELRNGNSVDNALPTLEASKRKEAYSESQIASSQSARSSPAAAGNSQSAMLMVITGPNMAGKSTYIRQTALLVLLAQIGSYVPAKKMRLSATDRLFARIGASDEITRGQSTFMVEMTEAANILNNATAHSLVVLDELGRGTSTFDGLSLAWAIAEQLVNQIKCRALFATHYHELTQLQENLKGAVNFNVAVREWQDEIVFLYRIVPGGTDKSYGVHVAKLAGVPPTVIARSRELLAELEANFTSPRLAPKRSAKRTRRDDQPMLFADPAETVTQELRGLDLNATSPIDALKRIEEWQSRLRGNS